MFLPWQRTIWCDHKHVIPSITDWDIQYHSSTNQVECIEYSNKITTESRIEKFLHKPLSLQYDSQQLFYSKKTIWKFHKVLIEKLVQTILKEHKSFVYKLVHGLLPSKERKSLILRKLRPLPARCDRHLPGHFLPISSKPGLRPVHAKLRQDIEQLPR